MKTIINNKEIGVWLSNKLFKNLKERLNHYNEFGNKPKLNLAKTAYILNLLYYIPLKSDEKYEDGWIPICSEAFDSIKNYKSYINFLKNNEFIIEHGVGYSTTLKQCKRYSTGSRWYRKYFLYWTESSWSI